MTTQPEALRLAEALDRQYLHACEPAAAELRRLHEAHDWQYKMAGERLRRVEKLEAQRDALLEVLKLARSIIGHPDDAHSQMIDAAIKAVEEGK